jgi:beta-glucosidase
MVKKYLLISLLAVPALMLSFRENELQQPAEDDIEKIISGLTLEEKVGQMTNLTLATIAAETSGKIKLDSAKVHDMIVKNNIGSVQNVINQAYTIEEWHQMVNYLQRITLQKTRHKIPFLYCIDAVHGANYVFGATQFPHNIGLAATRNPSAAEQCAAITAAETRAAGIRYNFSPVLDVGRNQNWSRFGETFGEDTYLVTEMGTAEIRGYQGTDVSAKDKVAACMKHFVGYSVPQNGKDRAPAYIPEINLREYFLPPFRQAVKQGAKTLMVNSAEVNGVPVHASKWLLTDVLRGELGFKGVVISDWQDVLKMHERHRVAKSHKEAVFLAVNAGIDMCIVPFDLSFYNDLIALVKEGRISEQRINESVRRILQLKKDLGLFKEPYLESESVKLFRNKSYSQVAYQSALESITLLKNKNNILPLKQQKIFLTGPNSNTLSGLHGAWSYAWQGTNESLYPDSLLTIAEAFAENGKTQHQNTVVFKSANWNKAEALAAAKKSDVIVLCLGEPAYAETPGNTPELEFDPKQVELAEELSKAGKPMVLVLLEGRPRIIREIEPLFDAVVLAYWPGSQGARAIYDVVYGSYNPSGKLPFTYPRYSGTLLTYDHKLLDEAVEVVEPEYKYFYEFNPQYQFGHGLSYTTFAYSGLTVSRDTINSGETFSLKVKVANTGKIAGQEVVELYSRDLYASVTPSVRRLRKFTKISLKPGETTEVSFTLNTSDLSFVGQDMKWITEAGDFELMIGDQKKTVYVK